MPQRKVPAGKSGGRKKSESSTAKSSTPSIDPRFAQFRMVVKPSKIHRWGVYAGEDIPRGRKVIEYTGERISRKETKRRSDLQETLVYLFTLDNYWTIDGAVGGSGAEYINHSCDPSLVTVIRNDHILYMSRRPIRKGEELTVDYNFGNDIEDIKCSCGAKTCRGKINVD